MTQNPANPWEKNTAYSATRAQCTHHFIEQQLSPLFLRRTNGGPKFRNWTEITTEEEFWGEDGTVLFAAIRLKGFKISDWFPRAPGVFWSPYAQNARDHAWSEEVNNDPELGKYYSPRCKMDLIEEGGIGTVRLLPRRIDDEDCWFATALTGSACHAGIPLAVPDKVIRKSQVAWGDVVNVEGHVRFLQNAGLDETAARVHHARPLIVFVEKIQGVATRRLGDQIVITPVALFDKMNADYHRHRTQYTFVQCSAGSDSELDLAGQWIEKYVRKHAGQVITNFDEQRPFLANAPLSYQRLVSKTYDRQLMQHYGATIMVERIDQLIQNPVTLNNFGEFHMGHKVKVGGSAIINIDSTLDNVNQTIGSAHGLDPEGKAELEGLIKSLAADLTTLKATRADEARAIVDALDKAIVNASKPPSERKKNLLELSAKGLKDAAELVQDVMPGILTTATGIANFITNL
jgi:hypothetical protein